MPYVNDERKAVLDPHLSHLMDELENRGDLNYCITMLACHMLMRTDCRYEDREAIMGTLICAANEFYRRVLADYEDTKIIQNGDVYPPEVAETRLSEAQQQQIWKNMLTGELGMSTG